MRHFTWILTLPIAAIVASFAISNRGVQTLGLWPFPYTVTIPTYMVVFLPFLAGFLVGALVMWLSHGRLRRRAHRDRRELRRLGGEVEHYRAMEKDILKARDEEAKRADDQRVVRAAQASDGVAQQEEAPPLALPPVRAAALNAPEGPGSDPAAAEPKRAAE